MIYSTLLFSGFPVFPGYVHISKTKEDYLNKVNAEIEYYDKLLKELEKQKGLDASEALDGDDLSKKIK